MEIARCTDRAEASAAAAALIEGALREALRAEGDVSLVVSGGTTPARCFALLAQADLPWRRVQVTLTDERCVPVDDPASNEGMVRRQLLVNRAAAAEFVPLNSQALADMPRPAACTLVGMGADGHFASLFPDIDELGSALDPRADALCMRIETAASPHARVSMTLAGLVRSRSIVLLAFGNAKREILEAPGAYPVGHLLAQTCAPVRVIWTP